MRSQKLFVPICLTLASCGGGTDSGPALDTTKEIQRIGALTKIAVDFGSIFLLMNGSYLQARSSSGALTCPTSGTFTVTSPASGQYTVRYSSCNVGWTTLNGSIALQIDNSDLIATINLNWDAVQYLGSFRLAQAATRTTPYLNIEGSQTTLTSTGGTTFQLDPSMILSGPSNQPLTIMPSIAIFRNQNGGTENLGQGTTSASLPAHVQVQSLDNTGNFVRISPPYDGNLTFEHATMQINFTGNMTDSTSSFSVVFNSPTQSNIGTESDAWTNAMSTPHYDPSD